MDCSKIDSDKYDVITIEKDLQTLIVDEDTLAMFECVVVGDSSPSHGKWLHNGKNIKSCDKITYTAEQKETKTIHTMKITHVSEQDQGIYTLTCTNGLQKLVTSANLFVQKETIERVNYNSFELNEEGVRVIQHLRNVDVDEGDKVELKVVFREVPARMVWFRNNEILKSDDRIVITESNGCCSLMLLNSVPTDTDVYYVVSTTSEGIIQSSFCNVHVAPKSNLTNRTPRHPIVLDIPFETETFKNDTLRVICKAAYVQNTTIQWLHNETPITSSSNFVIEDFGGQYIGLKKTNCTEADAGEYKVQLRQELTDREHDSATCYVTITPMGLHNTVPKVLVRRPLMSAAACVGCKILFDCAFTFQDPSYHYVVWYIGPHKVKRTNSKFEVIFKGGEYLLFIKKLEPDMNGTIACEVRKSLPNNRSIQVASTIANLAIVPYSVIQMDRDSKIKKKKNAKIHHSYNENENFGQTSREINEVIPEACVNEVEISYSSLDEDIFYLHASKGESEVSVACKQQTSKSVEISWDRNIFCKTCWFAISIGQDDGCYVEAGMSSAPAVETRKPPLGTILKIMVRPAPAPEHTDDPYTRLYLEPAQEPVLKPPKSEVVRTIKEFHAHYTDTGHLLGYGSFGCVLLGRNKKENQHYAMKVIKLSSLESTKNAMREYEIMKRVQHSKLIQLVEAFQDQTSLVIIMEFLWGGELFDRIVQEDHIMEEDVVNYVKQICEGLCYLHNKNIAHLDIKPENIICLSPNTCQVKIIDFSIAMVLEDRRKRRTLQGTVDYMAPEALNCKELSLACDMWSLGVVCYLLLSGILPFVGDSMTDTLGNITQCRYNYDDEAFENVSLLAKNFVDKLLLLNDDLRMSAQEALQHDWLKSPKGAYRPGHMLRTRKNLKTYLIYRAKWQRVGNVMIAANRLRAPFANFFKGEHRNGAGAGEDNLTNKQDTTSAHGAGTLKTETYDRRSNTDMAT